MVCDKCEKKLDKVAAPDVWKTGARNIMGGKDGGRTVGGNKLLEKKTYSYDPYGAKCKLCKCNIQGKNMYCHTCAYHKGLCSMCGVKQLNVKFYKQSDH